MYQTHWGLERPPFPTGLDPHSFFEDASQRESRARLRFLVNQARRLGLVLGESGVGKSLLLEVFAQECRERNRVVAQVDLLGLSSREFAWQLGVELQARVRMEDDLLRLVRLVSDRLHENQIQGTTTVLLLDNADQAGPELLTYLLRLANFHPLDDHGFSIVLAANGSQIGRLGSALLERVDLRIDLQPWDELDTTGYLQLALVEAGSERPLFDDQALSEVYRLTGGIPRQVNRLADYALLAGSGAGHQTVSSATIQSAYEAIRMPSSA